MKKLITIFLVAFLLILSAGCISAADDDGSDGGNHPITVSIKWNDNGQTSARPGSVVVNLIKDGSVVDSKTLSASNSWTAKFNVDDSGSYSVSEETPAGYSVSKSGGASSGFVITNTLKEDVLAASENEDTTATAETDEIISDDNSTDTTENSTDTTENSTSENNNETDTSDENTTDETGSDVIDDTTDSTEEDVEITTTTTVKEVQKDVKKVDKKVPKKPKNVTKNKLRNTGIPAVILVVAVFAAALVPFRRNK